MLATNFKILSAILIIGFLGCQPAPDKKEDTGGRKKTEYVKKPRYSDEKDFAFQYLNLKEHDSLRANFKKRYTAAQLKTILSLNRIDRDHIGNLDTMIIPNKLVDDFLYYAPFPDRLEVIEDVYKMAIFSYPIQAYALYEDGVLVKWGPSSLGKQNSLTPTGLFFTNWKGEEVISTANDEWLLKWNFNIENEDGIGWHQYTLPGYPASASCLRLLEEDARWMFDWADEWILEDANTVKAKGIPVIVFGAYDFNGPKPWYALLQQANATEHSVDELKSIISPHLPEIMKEQANRDSVVVKKPVTERED